MANSGLRCEWCNDAWGREGFSIMSILSEECSSYTLPIAPVPQSIIQLQSSYNATWTGTLLGTKTIGGISNSQSSETATTTSGNIGAGGSSEEEDETSTSTGTSSLSTEPGAEVTGPTTIYDGGGEVPTVIRTAFGGPANGDATASPTEQSSEGGSGAVGLRVEAGYVFAAFALAFAGSCEF